MNCLLCRYVIYEFKVYWVVLENIIFFLYNVLEFLGDGVLFN